MPIDGKRQNVKDNETNKLGAFAFKCGRREQACISEYSV